MPTQPEATRPSPIRCISQNVFILGIVSFFTDASTEMLYPLIPLFITKTLGAPVAVVGIIEGAAEATASLMKAFSGWMSDRVGLRRPFVIGGYGLAAVTKPLMALATVWPMVMAARVLDRFGKGVRGTPRDALIADSTPPELRGRAFGFHRSADQTGAVIGPLLALPLLALFSGNYRALFLAAFFPAAAGVAFLVAVRETGHRATGAVPPPRFRMRDMSPAFKKFLAITILFAAGNSSDAFIILRAQQLGMTAQKIVLLYAGFNLIYVLSAYPAGVLSDRLGRKRVVAAGWVVFALVYLGFGIARSPLAIWILFICYGVYMGLTDGVIRAFIVDLVKLENRGSALGLQGAATGIATFPASAIAGLLWQRIGPSAAFFYGAATAAAAALALAALRVKRPQPAA